MDTEQSILVMPTKTAVFQAVNKNNGSTGAPPTSAVTAPKFKISRGTQSASVANKYLMATSPPPVPAAKPPFLLSSKQLNCNKSPAPPPVPPKPKIVVSNKPVAVASAKPALPPKPLNLNGQAPPIRPLRTRGDSFIKGILQPVNKEQQLPVSPVAPSRKCASLGRLEGMRILSQLSNGDGDGYQPLVFPSTEALPPAAPPRRRRKSVDTIEPPIYAVVDFSKKINRRNLLSPPPPSDSEMELSIENSFAAIIESFSHHSEDQVEVEKTVDHSPPPPAVISSEEEGEEEEEPGVINRLVFGGVIQQTDFVVLSLLIYSKLIEIN